MSDFTPDTAVVSVNADLVKAALPFAAKQDVRYYLNGVCIRPAKEGGALIIATDGHIMVCLRDPEGVADQAHIIPLQLGDARHLKRDHKLCLGADRRAWVHDDNLKPRWICPGLEIAGMFPDVFDLLAPVQQYAEGLVGTFNPALIDTIRKGARGKYSSVRFYHRKDSGANSAAVFTYGPHGFGILMPMRGDGDLGTALTTAIPVEFQKAA